MIAESARPAESGPWPQAGLPILALRFAALAAMAVWVGGFTFYGGIVVPILDDALGSLDAGQITRRVTDRLNQIGLATVAVWALGLVVDRRHGRFPAVSAGFLAVSLTTLLGLFWMHVRMDAHLDTVGLTGFKPWHRAYLMTSTIQWAANLGLLAATVRRWGAPAKR